MADADRTLALVLIILGLSGGWLVVLGLVYADRRSGRGIVPAMPEDADTDVQTDTQALTGLDAPVADVVVPAGLLPVELVDGYLFVRTETTTVDPFEFVLDFLHHVDPAQLEADALQEFPDMSPGQSFVLILRRYVEASRGGA